MKPEPIPEIKPLDRYSGKTVEQWKPIARALTELGIQDPVEDGPEVGVTSFFHVFPDGNVKGLQHWIDFIDGIECDSHS